MEASLAGPSLEEDTLTSPSRLLLLAMYLCPLILSSTNQCGQVFTVFDEKGRKIEDANTTITLMETCEEYKINPQTGKITLPFLSPVSTQSPKTQLISIKTGNYASLGQFSNWVRKMIFIQFANSAFAEGDLQTGSRNVH